MAKAQRKKELKGNIQATVSVIGFLYILLSAFIELLA